MDEYSYGIIIYKKDVEYEYLVLLRSEGWLDFPKGHIEKNEDEFDAAIRETFEETNIMIDKNDIEAFFSYTMNYSFNKGDEIINKHTKMFLAEYNNNEIKISKEHVSYEWLNYHELLRRLRYINQKDMVYYAEKYLTRRDAINEINMEYMKLPDMIKTWRLSRNFVPGEGNYNAEIVFVGQAPGKTEDEMKRPFVGRSGRILNSMLSMININRESVYITSVVQFYPEKNRVPDKSEIDACFPYLKRQLDVISPKIIVILGRIAAQSLLGINDIKNNHGTIINKRYFITYHPAAALRSKTVLSKMENDFIKLKNEINRIKNQ
ncbi:uracil-DNA glycosylase family protein [Picrophilus oshimae]|uniref:Bis(5'-nucleosyl)-tetraphosphatase [asymmetrical] n=1 Tax=Picrophilus torridus (strain ATCC 700027 / DSM 9790 / JCM 10055 / NBRC 100828 / KAW 2/3) TaxID=1122961 RepID=A0A8G2FXB6_PICTO|nr:uracil-DNA glycosylase family protein [Picrophilus oshimae]SMD31232.1 DNA polymerase [Picrophilus oshimae DSM 9789]